jgi:hypothetical protein
MGRIGELPPVKPRTTSPRRGLRKLSPDLISKARDETAAQVTRIGLTFLGTAAFCLLSLLSPDSALLGGNEKINVPLAGPVSFFGFMLLGPAILIMLRVYLQIYVEHSDRLDRLARSASVVRAPTLVPLQNQLIRLFSGLVFYMLLPVTMMLFAWKAAVFPAWGSTLFVVAVAVIASHVMLRWFNRFSWRSKGLLSVSAAIIAGGVMLGFGPPHRQFDLFRANLSGHWLLEENLRKANLELANLRDANLSGAAERRRPELCQPERRQPEPRQPERRRPGPRQPERRRPGRRQPERRCPGRRQPERRRPEQSRPERRQPGRRRPEQSRPERRLQFNSEAIG